MSPRQLTNFIGTRLVGFTERDKLPEILHSSFQLPAVLVAIGFALGRVDEAVT